MQRVPHFVAGLGDRGDAIALMATDTAVTYRQLTRRMAEMASQLGTGRRLVAVTLTNDISAVVAYLAALSAGHVVMVLPPDRNSDLLAAFPPDTVVIGDRVEIRCPEPAHAMHPDLAVLLSTSGSTGSPRLVRLSYDNLDSNAAAIADYQELTAEDRCITSLPLHYCYGMSVLHSHLLVGGSAVLTEGSVVDACFWDLAEQRRVTTLAGVPHTYDLLDRADMRPRLPRTLRLLTQAGGALGPDRVRDIAGWCRRTDREFLVMYGQAEATARIAYLPAPLAETHPDCVGIPLPGGHVSIAAPDAEGVGELVYEGPNVMLGYAMTTHDLARGRNTHRLHTGDRAALTADGLIRIVGRHSRRAKLYGLRIDLDRIDAALRERGSTAHCASDDLSIIVAARHDDPVSDDELRQTVTLTCGLPPSSTAVVRVTEIPRTSSGKPDYPAIAHCRTLVDGAADAWSPADARTVVARTLRLDPATVSPQDTFVSLGGDSLSYVLTAQQLSTVVDPLPRDWHLMPLAHLTQESPPDRSRQRIESSVVVRALAVLAVVASHIGVIDVRGGAFILMALAGMSFARFPLATDDHRERVRRVFRSWRRIAMPSALWLTGVALLSDEYQWPVVLGTNLFGPPGPAPEWRYWFVESLIYILLAVATLLAIPAVHRWERTDPWVFAMAIVSIGLALRFTMLPGAGPQLASPATMLWFFAVGWALVMARTRLRTAITFAALLAGLPGFFVAPSRGLLIVVALCLVVMLPMITAPRWVAAPLSAIAAASLFLYLTHWQVFPLLQHWPWLALVACIAVGLVAHRAYEESTAFFTRRTARRTPPVPGIPTARAVPPGATLDPVGGTR